MLISNKIRSLIEQSRIQQKELAERIGMTQMVFAMLLSWTTFVFQP